MGDWCRSTNDWRTKVKEVADAEKEPDKFAPALVCYHAKELKFLKGEIFSLDRCPLMGDPRP